MTTDYYQTIDSTCIYDGLHFRRNLTGSLPKKKLFIKKISKDPCVALTFENGER